MLLVGAVVSADLWAPTLEAERHTPIAVEAADLLPCGSHPVVGC